MEVTVSAQEIGLTLNLSELREGANELQRIWRAQAIPYQESAKLSQDLLSLTRRIEGGLPDIKNRKVLLRYR